MVKGVLQNQDGAICVKTSAVRLLQLSDVDMRRRMSSIELLRGRSGYINA